MKTKNIWADVLNAVVVVVVVVAFIGVIFLKNLFQNISSESFSFERMFDSDNVYESLLIYFFILILIAPLYVIFKRRK